MKGLRKAIIVAVVAVVLIATSVTALAIESAPGPCGNTVCASATNGEACPKDVEQCAKALCGGCSTEKSACASGTSNCAPAVKANAQNACLMMQGKSTQSCCAK